MFLLQINKQTKELKTPPTWTKQQLIDLILAKSITFLLMNFNMGIGDWVLLVALF